MSLTDLMFVGLVFDIAGAAVLTIGLLKTKRTIILETTTYLGRNLPVVKATLQPRSEAIVGLASIVIGFGLQLCGNAAAAAGIRAELFASPLSAAVVVLILAIIGCATSVARIYATRTFFRYIFRAWSPGAPTIAPRPNEPDFLDRIGELWDCPHRQHESDAEYLDRLRKRQQQLGREFGPAAARGR
jgi:hypothetical protein